MTTFSAAALAAALVAGSTSISTRVGAQSAMPVERGAAALGSTLDALGTTGRVLVIGAHPDDEDTNLITWLTRGRHVETAYLSLTRGDGGQNLIGNELGEALGIIRTQELLSARRIDGGRQYFTRAYDFGFSKNAEETLEHWPRDSVFGDVIRVVRAFRPHVIIAIFSGTPRDGHGHHQVSGILAREAYDVSADTTRFPTSKFGEPWTVQKFYRSARFAPEQQTLTMNVGEYSPMLGRSYAEIAAESRSQHKSQGFGVLQRKGAMLDYLSREASRVSTAESARAEHSLFDGIDTTWSRLARLTTDPVSRAALDSAARAFNDARGVFRPQDPGAIVAPLAKAVRLLRVARASGAREPAQVGTATQLATIGVNATSDATPTAPRASAQGAAELWDALTLTLGRAEQALVLASGVAVEATAPRKVFPVRDVLKPNVNDSLPVTITVFNRGTSSLRIEGSAVTGTGGRPPGIIASSSMRSLPRYSAVQRSVERDSATSIERWITASAPTAPWWLDKHRSGDLFAVSIDSNDEVTRESFTMPTAVARVTIADVPVDIFAPIVNRYADPVRGDQQVQVAAVPGITVGLENVIEYMRADVPIEREVRVHVLSAYPESAAVSVSLQLPAGLTADSADRIRTLTPAAPSAVVTFRVKGRVSADQHQLAAIVRHESAPSFSGYYTIDYDHITPQRMYGPSGMWLSAVNVKIPPRALVGYVRGVSDHAPAALQQLDVSVEEIDPATLPRADLSRFTAIIVGPRAYEARPALVANNRYLLSYANRGGTLVVQYGQYEMMQPGVMPYPIELSRPAERVTMEEAPVRMLSTTAPLLTTPNRITAADWGGWVQERATYMPSRFDPHYVPMLAMNDPGEPENRGALLVAPVGKGRYVYVTLALFRQLPNGIPGAARILMNLITAPPPPVTAPKM